MLEPVIKWSGSKRTQANEISSFINGGYDTYYELFCGGCSMMFYILNNYPNRFKKFVCNDINDTLISTFNLIECDPYRLCKTYSELWKELNSDNDLERKKRYFTGIRDEMNKTHSPELFFFIMRTTTNGMPRYNAEGEFNSSFHLTRNGMEPSRLSDIILKWSEILNRHEVEFRCGSYEKISPRENDMMYLDPPYFKTKGMYYGTIDYEKLWQYLRNAKCDYILSFDGVAGEENNIADVPNDIYTQHLLLNSGSSSFRRIVGKSSSTIVYESLYLKLGRKPVARLF